MKINNMNRYEYEEFVRMIPADLIRKELYKYRKGLRKELAGRAITSLMNDEILSFVIDNQKNYCIIQCMEEYKNRFVKYIDFIMPEKQLNLHARISEIADALSRSLLRDGLDVFFFLTGDWKESERIAIKEKMEYIIKDQYFKETLWYNAWQNKIIATDEEIFRSIMEDKRIIIDYRSKKCTFTSVFTIKTDSYSNIKYLCRVADVQGDGKITYITDNAFHDIKRIYNYIPENASEIGVWYWKRYSNSLGFRTVYEDQLTLIKIIYADTDKYSNIDSYIKNRNSITFKTSAERMIIVFGSSEEGRTGLLLEPEDLEPVDKGWKLKSECRYTKVLEVNPNDIIMLNGSDYYNNVFISRKPKIELIKEPDIISDIFFENNDLQYYASLRQMPDGVSNDPALSNNISGNLCDLYEEIVTACGCSIHEAEQYFDKYLRARIANNSSVSTKSQVRQLTDAECTETDPVPNEVTSEIVQFDTLVEGISEQQNELDNENNQLLSSDQSPEASGQEMDDYKERLDTLAKRIEDANQEYAEVNQKILTGTSKIESIEKEYAKRLSLLNELENNTKHIEESRHELEEVNIQLNSIKKQIEEALQEKEAISHNLIEVKGQVDLAENAYAEKLSLANDLDQKIKERMKKAEQDVAGFLAERGLLGSINQNTIAVTERNSSNRSSTYVEGFVAGEDVVEIKTASDLSYLLQENLEYAGVDEVCSMYVAKLLIAAYFYRKPMLIAGPNANQIIEAFSITLCGRHPGWLDINGAYDPMLVDQLRNSGDQVIGIKNIFHGEWISRLPEIIDDEQKFFIISHPFSEDLQIEPKGLFNYILPLITDMLIDNKASGEY